MPLLSLTESLFSGNSQRRGKNRGIVITTIDELLQEFVGRSFSDTESFIQLTKQTRNVLIQEVYDALLLNFDNLHVMQIRSDIAQSRIELESRMLKKIQACMTEKLASDAESLKYVEVDEGGQKIPVKIYL